jgi:methionyl-tRNA synthetase
MSISFDDFSKVELKIAKVLDASPIEKSEKLLKLQVDLGSEQRQIVAGLGKTYSPEELVGKSIVVVTNLEPRSLMGEESNGMVLAASDLPVTLIPDRDVEPGTSIH